MCIILLCLVLVGCAAPQVNRGVTITVEDGGVRMPNNVGHVLIPCTKDQSCVAVIR